MQAFETGSYSRETEVEKEFTCLGKRTLEMCFQFIVSDVASTECIMVKSGEDGSQDSGIMPVKKDAA